MQKPITDINGLEVSNGDVVRFTENHTDLAIFDNWVERVYEHPKYGLITNSPLAPQNGHRKLVDGKFEIIWPLLSRGAK